MELNMKLINRSFVELRIPYISSFNLKGLVNERKESVFQLFIAGLRIQSKFQVQEYPL